MPLSQLQPSSSHPFLIDLRKEGVRTPNGKHFPRSITETDDFYFCMTNGRTANDLYFKVGITLSCNWDLSTRLKNLTIKRNHFTKDKSIL